MAVGIMAIANNLAFQGQEAVYTTTSNTYVFTGTGVIFIPKTSGIVKISLNANVSNNTAGDGVAIDINYATGTVLAAAGAAATGTGVLASAIGYESATGKANNTIGIIYQLTGLTLGTSYIFQPVFYATTGGTASFTQINMWAEEI